VSVVKGAVGRLQKKEMIDRSLSFVLFFPPKTTDQDGVSFTQQKKKGRKEG